MPCIGFRRARWRSSDPVPDARRSKELPTEERCRRARQRGDHCRLRIGIARGRRSRPRRPPIELRTSHQIARVSLEPRLREQSLIISAGRAAAGQRPRSGATDVLGLASSTNMEGKCNGDAPANLAQRMTPAIPPLDIRKRRDTRLHHLRLGILSESRRIAHRRGARGGASRSRRFDRCQRLELIDVRGRETPRSPSGKTRPRSPHRYKRAPARRRSRSGRTARRPRALPM